MNQTELQNLLQRYRLRPTKTLGQHYLVDDSVLAAILAAAEISPNEPVVEIGAGPGILTAALAQAGADVLAVEFDRNFCRLLQDEFHNWRNIHVLCDDALRIDFATLEKEGQPYRKMVANIPYQITNPLVRKILEADSPITTAVLLIQKEVAERLMAPPGSRNRGILTIMVEATSTITKILDVPAAAFWPSPKVESTVVKIQKTKQPNNPDNFNEKAFFWLVKQGFSGKRKKLPNSLSGGLQVSKTQALSLVTDAKISPDARAEDLTLAEWQQLFATYQKQQG